MLSIHTVLDPFMWGFGIVIVVALFLALTQVIEEWIKEDEWLDD